MMKRYLAIILLTLAAGVCWMTSCVHQPQVALISEGGNYPTEVAKIIINKCAISGCHNAASYQNADGLLLDTWEHLFDGGNSGAAVVAFSPRFSPLLYFVNTDPARGPVSTPTMPQSTTSKQQSPLTKDEYTTLENWIANGAPDKNGNIPFSANPDTRQKIYLTNQGCDLLAVIDVQKNVVMRYIEIGANPAANESPHCVRVSGDGQFAYVSFLNGNYIQKIDTRTDKVVGAANLGPGSWNILFPSPDNSSLATTDWQSNGQIVFVNTGTMQTIPGLTGSGSGVFVYPHGITSNSAFDTLFITGQYGNVIYKYAPHIPWYNMISLNSSPAAATTAGDNTSPNPHEILMSPDGSRYFVSCQGTNEVRVMDAHKDTLIAVIPVGTFPQELAMSSTLPYLFVSCMEDAANPLPGRKGSVHVINYNTLQPVQTLYGDFYQPHGIAVDDRDGLVYIASTNANPNGPAPHHATACAGRAGWYTVYNINTLKPLNSNRYEVTVMPYSAAPRFK